MAETPLFGRTKCLLNLALLLTAIVPFGCSRTWYRLDADEESYGLVEEKSAEHPEWAYRDLNVYMDPRSRLYDPTDPDNPPMPRDDPASHQYMHCAYCMSGYPHWHDDGELDQVENPAWRAALHEYLTESEDGRYLLSLEDAVHLAYLHSPDYQEQVENLYLSSMDLAFERFRFDVQFFGGIDGIFTHNGRLSPFGESNLLGVGRTAQRISPGGGAFGPLGPGRTLQARKLFATGGELAVGFANSFVWQFAGPDTNQTTSLLNFGLAQPLLRGAGRDVVMETLTLSERVLLANLRAMERYRKMFYMDVAVGDNAFGGPVRRGGFLGGAGLSGFVGTQGGFGGVGQATQFGRFGFGGQEGGGAGAGGAFVAAVAGPQGGFIGLVQRLQQLRNQESTLQNLLREQERMEALFEAGRIESLQVDQFRASVQTQRSDLVNARNNFQGEIDQYLTQTLGLPPDVPVEFDDSYVRQFQFFDPDGLVLDRKITAFIAQLRGMTQPTAAQLHQAVASTDQLLREVVGRVETVHADFELLDSRLNQRLQLLADEDERTEFLDELRQLRESFQQIQQNITADTEELKALQARAGMVESTALLNALIEFVDGLSERLVELSLVQARARLESVVIEPVDLGPEEALAIARANRLDWMNQRAGLVDQWRLIAFVADRLESDLDLIFSGDVSTKRDNMFDFRGQTGALAVGLQFDAPLTRVSERNQYRDVLVDYQRARRDYIRFVDFVQRTLRQHLRNLDQARETLELQRRQFVINMRQFDVSRLNLREPPPPAEPGQLAQTTFAATLARDLLDALNGLLTAQNNVMNVWVQYETTRQQLLRDLGIMQVDERGMPVEVDLASYLEEVRTSGMQDEVPPAIDEYELLPPMPRGESSEQRVELRGPDLRQVLRRAGVTPVQLASARELQPQSRNPLKRIARAVEGIANRPAGLPQERDREPERIPEAPATSIRGRPSQAAPVRPASGTGAVRPTMHDLKPSTTVAPRSSSAESKFLPPSPAEQKARLPWRKRFRRIIF